jgi:predicted lipoprotein with Yx(FWY)xxD motif
MKTISTILLTALLALAGCGDDDGSGGSYSPAPRQEPAGKKDTASAPARRMGTRIALADSQFGRMLVDSRKQAIYIFEKDPKGKTVCYGECAAAWPPVFTKADPRAGAGVKSSLLGTVKRRDGRLQVTYAGKPLYFYAHEDPGVVLCHNVNLNGGLWWVVGPDGKRRP